jgi:Gpi18-like mannosyltransferase
MPLKINSFLSTVFIVFWLICMVALLISAFGFNFPTIDEYLKVFTNWDGGHFLDLIEHGYTRFTDYAFFPLFPMIVRLMSFGLNSIVTGFLLNSLLLGIGLWFFFQLLMQDYAEKISQKIILLFLIFPTSFFMLMFYTESLFFALTISSIYFARRGKYGLATILAGLSATTRIFGLATIAALWIEAYEDNIKKHWIVLLAPLGFVAYIAFMYFSADNPWVFLEAETLWHRSYGFEGLNIFQHLIKIAKEGITQNNITSWLEYVFTVFGVGVVMRLSTRLRISYVCYGIISLLIPLLTNSLQSMPRFLLMVFPIFIMLGTWEAKKMNTIIYKIPWLGLYVVVCIGLWIFYLYRFANGIWAS